MSKYAIVGLSCLFPGAASPAEFWQNLSTGVDSRSAGGADVFGPAAPGDPEHRIYCTTGGFVRDFAFDPTGYRLAAEPLARLDRVFHWSLHVAREALRDSGHAERAGLLARTGLVLGNYSFPTPGSARISLPLVREAVRHGLGRPVTPELDRSGLDPADARVSGAPARIVGAALGLGGPRYALDAACSSALYALKLACDHLATGQADLVLAGGVCAPDPTLIHLCFSDLRAYPEDGFSQPFDARSSGILTGQGAGVFAVRRLADALRDGDRIHAVIDGIGLGNDGGARHLLVPDRDGQQRSYQLAYAASELTPAEIDYLECHATGTPIGDATEAESVAEWFGAHGRVPLLGSVKGNLGHLLTVAGVSSLLKVILAMRHGEIPATIGVSEPIPGAGQLVRAKRDWPAEPGARRAAVSAFGFGGTNAHVVLRDSAQPEHTPQLTPPAVDIVGLGAHFGSFRTAAEYERAVHDGRDAFGPLPERRWRGMEQTAGGTLSEAGLTGIQGAFVDAVDVDPVDHRIPPADLRNYNLQHALMSEVADEALADAGFGKGEGRRVAVVVAMETEPSAHLHLARYRAGDWLPEPEAGQARAAIHEPIGANEVLSYIGNIMAARISARWNLTGPSFTISAEAAGTAQALELARLLLLDETVEAVLVGAVDLAGSPESLLLRDGIPATAPGLTFGAGSQGRRVGEGAGAVVLTRAGERPSYARLDAVAVRHPQPVDGELPLVDSGVLAEAAEQALAEAGIGAAEVGYLEAHAGGTPAEDEAELRALARVYPTGTADLALGSAKAQLGDAQGAAAMAGLLRAVFSLHHGYQPGVPGWQRPESELLAASGCHVPESSRPWLRARRGGRRYAAVNFIEPGGAHGHLVLSADRTRGAVAERDWRRAGGPVLLALGAPDPSGLLAEVERHRALLAEGADPLVLAQQAAARLTGQKHRVVLVGDLPRQLELAARDLPDALQRGEGWATPDGSCFTPRPIGPEGKVALVYPGAFNSYPGLGRDLFRAFPGLLDRFEAEAAEPDRTFRTGRLHPRTLSAPSRKELMALEAGFGDDLPFLLATGTTFAILHTDLVRELLGVPVHGAFGYSLGESSMLFATGGWQRGARRDDRIGSTPLFQDRLCGPRRTVRELWQLPEDTPDAAVWAGFVLLTEAARVRAALPGYDRVFLTHINTPGELVIAGDPAQCRALIAELGCQAAPSPVKSVMHCPVVDGELAGLAELNDHPTGSPGELELLSAYDYQPVGELDQKVIAGRIAHTLRSTIDFPRLVRAAYDRGFRAFIEVGPGATCGRWIRDTLGEAAHVAVSVDRRGVPTARAVAQLVARLVAHGVPVDLAGLLGPAPRPAAGRTVAVGGGPSIPGRLAAARAVPGSEPVDAITFDGEPLAHLPWAEPGPDLPEPPAPAATSDAAAELVRELREQLMVTHSVVMETQRVLQESTLARTEALLSRPPERRQPTKEVIWDQDDLLEFATGSLAKVFGAEYAEIDSYGKRVRLPAPPYHFVTRVTALDARTGVYQPSFIRTEYDVPQDAWYAVDGGVPPAVAIEAGQCDLLLISYLGIDFRNRGQRVYRLLDSTLVFHGDLPRAGQTLRYDISINRFVTQGETTLFFFSYRCYADGELILELKDATAGFFSQAELETPLGVVITDQQKAERAALTRSWFKPLARTGKNELTAADLDLLAQGRVGEVFGPEHAQDPGLNPALRLPTAMLRMADEIRIDRTGGPRGLGAITATKQLDPEAWYFECHFPDDPVLAGSLVAEGAVQVLQTYLLHQGMHLVLPDARFQTIIGLQTEVQVRGQITPKDREIRYEIEVMELTMLPRPSVVADILVYLGDKPVIRMHDFGIQIREKPGTPYRPELGGIPAFLGRRNRGGEPAMINELHLAHAAKGDLGTAMGPEFDVYANSRAPYIPNGDFQFVDRIMSLTGTRGDLGPGSEMVTEYDSPEDAWYYQQGYLPNCVLMETSLQAAILLGYYLGATLKQPGTEYSIRNLDGRATVVKDLDLRGRTIRHHSRLLMTSAVSGAVLQNFSYELSADGEVFYVGESLFGYFSEAALANQTGLDAGQYVAPWLDEAHPATVERIDPRRYFSGELRLPDGHFDLIDQVDLVPGGGRHGLGYLHGYRKVRPDEWYFDCHFHRDPVMPGSLGVEAVLQALRLYALRQGLAEGIDRPAFALATDVEMSWKYRGQILRQDGELRFDVHVREVRREAGRVLVIADADLWKPGLRIYELTGAAIEIRTSGE